LCFALETPQSSRIRSHALGQELQRDAAMQLEIFSLVDHTHPAAAQLAQDAVVRDGFADHWRGILLRHHMQVNESREFESVVGSLHSVPIRTTIRSMHGKPQLKQISAASISAPRARSEWQRMEGALGEPAGDARCGVAQSRLSKRDRGLAGPRTHRHLSASHR